jgi:hypothetical protein
MSAIVLGFASRMGSGRRELSKRVAQSLGLPRVSFGEYVRSIARERGHGEVRDALQQIGETLVAEDCEAFCRDVLSQAEWEPGQSLVVDGIRHTEVEEVLERLVKPSLLVILFLDVDNRLRLTRLREDNITTGRDLERVESHSTEAQVQTVLHNTADLIIEGNQTDEILTRIRVLIEARNFLFQATVEEIALKAAEMAQSDATSSVDYLRESLILLDEHGYDKQSIPRLLCRALLCKGDLGVYAMASAVRTVPGLICPATIMESLWFAGQGQRSPAFPAGPMILLPPLDDPIIKETINAAREALYDLIVESRVDGDLFDKLLHFLNQNNTFTGLNSTAGSDLFRSWFFEVIGESSIRITRRLIGEFERLVKGQFPERTYQQFLAANPVFIDPLAATVIDRQKLGLEHITDFVIRRLDNEYILVEIEKPQDNLFTANNDFTADFVHAFGQVIDFQEWVDSHAEYARHLMPDISSPRGMLVMGRKQNLTPEQAAKLKRYCINSRSIEVLTYDDLAKRARVLYENIHNEYRYAPLT